MSKIGIIAALPAEAKCLYKKKLQIAQPVEIEKDTFLCLSGIGHDAANTAIGKLLTLNIRALVSWGVAGALDPALNSGDLLIANTVIFEDEQYDSYIDWSTKLNTFYSSHSCNTVQGNIVSTSSICSSIEAKQEIAKSTGALAIDMESAAVAQAAKEYNLKFIVLRAIADGANTSIPNAVLEHTNALGQPRPWGFFCSCVKEPGQIKQLLRLARCFNAAIKTLNQGAMDLKKQHFLYNT